MPTTQHPPKPQDIAQRLRSALVQRAVRTVTTKGRITCNGIPGLLDHYLGVLGTTIKTRPHTEAAPDALRHSLPPRLELAPGAATREASQAAWPRLSARGAATQAAEQRLIERIGDEFVHYRGRGHPGGEARPQTE